MKENVSLSSAAKPQQLQEDSDNKGSLADQRQGQSQEGSVSPIRRNSKSLIPVRTPPKVHKVFEEEQKRKPLTPIQGLRKSKMIGGRQLSSAAVISSSPPPKKLHSATATSTPKSKNPSSPLSKSTSAPSCSSSPIPAKNLSALDKKNTVSVVDKEVQTDHPDLALITGDEAPPSYWKDLAETRRVALEDALNENETLHRKVEELEKENRVMEEIIEHATNLTQMINSLPEEDSGIAADESVRSTDQSQTATDTADQDEENND